jgi:hypothetical protein
VLAYLGRQPEVARAEPWDAEAAVWAAATEGEQALSRAYPDRAHGQLTLRRVPPGGRLQTPPIVAGRWLPDGPGGEGQVVVNTAALRLRC